jgi:NAD(P)-dependent dehydrogenase (short-subunit alcohol dehydrogenase family)
MITGASSGIGRDLATTFARMGAKVILVARRQAVLDELARDLAEAGGDVLVLAADVTRRADVRDAVDRALAHFGRIDVLVNSAGVAIPDRVETMPPEDLERMMSVNLMGTLHTMQAVLPSMRAAGAGSIVNIASLAGRRGMPPLGAYCATKFAVVGLTEALRVELYGSGIRLSLVMPGVIDTPMVREPSPQPTAINDSSRRAPSAQPSAADVSSRESSRQATGSNDAARQVNPSPYPTTAKETGADDAAGPVNPSAQPTGADYAADRDSRAGQTAADDTAGQVPLKLIPDSMLAMPVQWVTWAVIAAVVLGLAEVDVPPGAVVMEKIAALFPSLTDAFLALGTRLFDWATRH